MDYYNNNSNNKNINKTMNDYNMNQSNNNANDYNKVTDYNSETPYNNTNYMTNGNMNNANPMTNGNMNDMYQYYSERGAEAYRRCINNCRCSGFYYVIKKGDTLYKISRAYGVSVSDLIMANPYVNVYNLQINDEICIPKAINLNLSM